MEEQNVLNLTNFNGLKCVFFWNFFFVKIKHSLTLSFTHLLDCRNCNFFKIVLGIAFLTKFWWKKCLRTLAAKLLFNVDGKNVTVFGEVALSIVKILETFRRNHLAELARSAGTDLAVQISNEEVKEILAGTEFGLGSYLKSFKLVY